MLGTGKFIVMIDFRMFLIYCVAMFLFVRWCHEKSGYAVLSSYLFPYEGCLGLTLFLCVSEPFIWPGKAMLISAIVNDFSNNVCL